MQGGKANSPYQQVSLDILLNSHQGSKGKCFLSRHGFQPLPQALSFLASQCPPNSLGSDVMNSPKEQS